MEYVVTPTTRRRTGRTGVCPCCGNDRIFVHPANGNLLVCWRCAETLHPHELVRRFTRRRRRRYLRSLDRHERWLRGL